MTRAFLVFAMLCSLWPPAWVAGNVVLGDWTDEPSSNGGRVIDDSATTDETPDEVPGTAGPSPPDDNSGSGAGTDFLVDSEGYRRLSVRADRLIDRVNASDALRGAQPSAALTRSARRLESDFHRWRKRNGAYINAVQRKVALRQQQLMARTEAFASSPSQVTLDKYNAAIRAYNRAADEANG